MFSKLPMKLLGLYDGQAFYNNSNSFSVFTGGINPEFMSFGTSSTSQSATFANGEGGKTLTGGGSDYGDGGPEGITGGGSSSNTGSSSGTTVASSGGSQLKRGLFQVEE